MAETILIVDDEEPIRRTFSEWLRGLPVKVIAVADAEDALRVANDEPLDLAILDWNLGSGSDGLRLLEDLVEFQPDLVAILVTGYASQATPLEALRNGIRDYLDKNSDLNRETFLAAVQKQLNTIVPAKRQRLVTASLGQFRATVEKVLPLVRASAALNEPVPLTAALKSLITFAVKITGAADGALVVYRAGITTAYDASGVRIEAGTTAFSKSLAATAVSLQEPAIIHDLASEDQATLFPFEMKRKSLLAIPINVGGTAQVVLELFDLDPSLARRAHESLIALVASELLQTAFGERQTHAMIADAVDAALAASHDVSAAMGASPPSEPPPPAVMDALRRGLDASTNAVVDADLGLDLVAAVRELALRHGPDAVKHCVIMVRSLRALLDGST